MLRSFSNKAIATKARAMYGARVTQADYEELMKKRTVGDAAAYLRDNTHYREVLGQIDPAAIHRGQLEHLLRSLRYIQYQRLIAYNFGQQKLYRYLYFREEIQQLLGLGFCLIHDLLRLGLSFLKDLIAVVDDLLISLDLIRCTHAEGIQKII